MPVIYKVEITPSAEGDIAIIWDYLSQDSPMQANLFVDTLETQIKTLTQYPERCPLISENNILGTSYRHLLHGPYRTIFRISRRTVVILRVIHGSRLLNDDFFSS